MIDLHIHTNCSDGIFSVKEVLLMAEKNGCAYISLVDHNTCKGYKELDTTCCFSGKIISGCEFNTYYMGIPIELLGYDFHVTELADKISSFYLYSTKEILNIQKEIFFDNCDKRGVPYKIMSKFDDSVLSSDYYHECIKNVWGNTKYFDNIADFESSSNFYRKYMSNPKSIFYCDMSKYYPSLEQIISLIHQCGGLVFIPHVFEYKELALEILSRLTTNYHIDGLECYYSKFSYEEQHFICNYAKKMNMLISGGSDFHHGKSIRIGVGKGNLNIQKEMIGNWIDYATDYNVNRGQAWKKYYVLK